MYSVAGWWLATDGQQVKVLQCLCSKSSPLSVFLSLQETYEQKRKEHMKEMQVKEERMRQMFVQKVCKLSLFPFLSYPPSFLLSHMWHLSH